MKGKDKCKILKELRAQIAAANDIEWVTENCSHKGECRGTCPKCEAEVRMLERALERRRALGKTVALTGLAAGMIATSTACSQTEWQVRDGETLASQTAASQVSTAGEETADFWDVTMGEPIVEVDGDMALFYYITDFTLCQTRTYVTTEKIYFDSVMDSDGNRSVDREIPEGARFAVVGEMDDFLLVSYEDSYYCVWNGYLDERAVEVETDIAVDDSDDRTEDDE